MRYILAIAGIGLLLGCAPTFQNSEHHIVRADYEGVGHRPYLHFGHAHEGRGHLGLSAMGAWGPQQLFLGQTSDFETQSNQPRDTVWTSYLGRPNNLRLHVGGASGQLAAYLGWRALDFALLSSSVRGTDGAWYPKTHAQLGAGFVVGAGVRVGAYLESGAAFVQHKILDSMVHVSRYNDASDNGWGWTDSVTGYTHVNGEFWAPTSGVGFRVSQRLDGWAWSAVLEHHAWMLSPKLLFDSYPEDVFQAEAIVLGGGLSIPLHTHVELRSGAGVNFWSAPDGGWEKEPWMQLGIGGVW